MFTGFINPCYLTDAEGLVQNFGTGFHAWKVRFRLYRVFDLDGARCF